LKWNPRLTGQPAAGASSRSGAPCAIRRSEEQEDADRHDPQAHEEDRHPQPAEHCGDMLVSIGRSNKALSSPDPPAIPRTNQPGHESDRYRQQNAHGQRAPRTHCRAAVRSTHYPARSSRPVARAHASMSGQSQSGSPPAVPFGSGRRPRFLHAWTVFACTRSRSATSLTPTGSTQGTPERYHQG